MMGLFGLIFSSYVSAEFGLEELISVNGSSDTLVKGFDFFDNYHINFQEIYPRPLNEMLLCLSESFDYPSEGGVVRLVENYFN